MGDLDSASSVTFATLIRDVLARLHSAGIAYMVTGSVASSYYGEPRATRDLDVVIDPDRESLRALVDGLIADGFYVDPQAAEEALDRRTQFNAIAPEALKVDFLLRKDRAFSIREFERRQGADLLGTAGFVTTAEDLIVAKLEWAARGESERQLRDVAGVIAVTGGEIDYAYVRRWIEALSLQAVWDRVKPDDDRSASAGARE